MREKDGRKFLFVLSVVYIPKRESIGDPVDSFPVMVPGVVAFRMMDF